MQQPAWATSTTVKIQQEGEQAYGRCVGSVAAVDAYNQSLANNTCLQLYDDIQPIE